MVVHCCDHAVRLGVYYCRCRRRQNLYGYVVDCSRSCYWGTEVGVGVRCYSPGKSGGGNVCMAGLVWCRGRRWMPWPGRGNRWSYGCDSLSSGTVLV